MRIDATNIVDRKLLALANSPEEYERVRQLLRHLASNSSTISGWECQATPLPTNIPIEQVR